MSNETANRSHAGLFVQLFADPEPPKLLANWGFIAATLQRESALGPGVYSIRLEQPASALVGPTQGSFESIDTLIVGSSIVETPALFARTILLPDPAVPAPAVGEHEQFPILAIELTDDSGQIDAQAIVQVELRAVPQQV